MNKTSVYQKFQINIKSLKSFYSTVERLGDKREDFISLVMEMVELISFYCSQVDDNQKLMCVRGLLMLMHNDRLSDYKWIEVCYELSKVLN